MYLSGLKATQYGTDTRPGLLTGKFSKTLYQQRHHTYLHMRFQATGQAMMNWFQLQLGTFEGAEAAFDNTQALVCTGCIFWRKGIIISLYDPLAISPGSLLDSFSVQTNVSFVSDIR